MQQVYVENLYLSIYLFCSLIKRGGSFIPSPLPDFISLGVAWGWGWRGSGCHVTVSYEPCTQALGDSICYPQITGKYSHMQTIQAIFVCTLTLPRGNFHHHIQNSMCLSVMVLYLCTWVCFIAAIHLHKHTQLCNHAHQVPSAISARKVKQSESRFVGLA